MKVGASNGYLIKKYGVEKSIEILAKAGFNSIDYSLEENDVITNKKLFFEFTDEQFDEYFKNVKALLDKHKIEVGQTHAYTGFFNWTTTEDYFNVTVKCIRATNILGCKYTVIHPIILPSYKYDENKEECKKHNMDFYTKLIPYLKKYDVKNGVEPMWNWDDEKKKICPTVCSRPEEIIDYIETLNSDRFVACLDIGHINLTCLDTGDTVEGSILKLGKYLEVLHVHDTDGIDDLHVPPYFMGNIEWKKVCESLKQVNYKGIFNFEVGGTYYDKFDSSAVQSCADYMCATGKFLTELIEG